MLRAAYHDAQRELLVDGRREDYEQLRDTVRQALAFRSEVALPVQSTGDTAVSHFVVRSGTPPNRVSYELGRVVFSVAPSLQEQFLSFVEFPADADLPDSPVQYHHHYDGLADDGTHVAPDSLPVVLDWRDYDRVPNHALQRTRHGVVVCNRCVPRAGSLSLGR